MAELCLFCNTVYGDWSSEFRDDKYGYLDKSADLFNVSKHICPPCVKNIITKKVNDKLKLITPYHNYQINGC